MQHPESESELTSMTDNEPAEFLSLEKLRDLNELDTDSDGLTSFIASKLSDSEASDHRRKRNIKLLSENIPALATPAKSLSLQKLIGLNDSIEEPTFSTDDDLPRIRKRSKRNRRKASKSQKPIGSVTQEIAII
ncbi:hypothetical protein K7432_009353 [Basidiobolus ranarum]|uniref:Uncharacterized protein n=1 Tax=Basidiobolus ranarum TaxID=34480 RepID=A0ABR2VX97_9FUNG